MKIKIHNMSIVESGNGNGKIGQVTHKLKEFLKFKGLNEIYRVVEDNEFPNIINIWEKGKLASVAPIRYDIIKEKYYIRADYKDRFEVEQRGTNEVLIAKMDTKTVFLGGSCQAHNKHWRKPYAELQNVNCFNPWVSNWNAEAQKNENLHREYDDYVLFTLDGPNTFSIAEVVDCSNKRANSTILIIDDKVMALNDTDGEKKSLLAIAKLVEANGAYVFTSHSEALKFLKTLNK